MSANTSQQSSSPPPDPEKSLGPIAAADPSLKLSGSCRGRFVTAEYTWTVHDFVKHLSAAVPDSSARLFSDKFVVPVEGLHNDRAVLALQLDLHPKKDDKDYKVVGCFLVNYTGERITARSQLRLLGRTKSYNVHTTPFKSYAAKKRNEAATGWGVTTAFRKDFVLSKTESPLLADGSLQVHCLVEVASPLSTSGPRPGLPKSQGQKRKGKEETTCQKLWKKRRESHDVTVKVGGSCIPAHKLFLTAASDIFAAMFAHDTKEKQTGIIDIKEFTAKTVEHLVEFIYLGELNGSELTQDEALDLLCAADKYSMQDLKEQCEDLLAKKVSFANASALAQVAVKYQAGGLKAAAVQFLAKNLKKAALVADWDAMPDCIVREAAIKAGSSAADKDEEIDQLFDQLTDNDED